MVSIIVPCYNQSEFLKDSLLSVFMQTYTNWECIIVNDGSIDKTEEVAKQWCNKDKRLSYVYQDNSGLASARNKGITYAKGEFILPLDADDKLGATYIESAIKAFNNDVKVVYCNAEKFGAISEDWKLEKFSLHNLSRNNMIFCSALFRKKDWEILGGYDENMLYGWEDWEFWISLLKNGGKVVKLNEVGFYYRIKENSMLTSIDREKSEYLLQYLNVKHVDFFVKYYGSFHGLSEQIKRIKEKHQEQFNSEKYVIDVFCSKFFGFTIFGKYTKGGR